MHAANFRTRWSYCGLRDAAYEGAKCCGNLKMEVTCVCSPGIGYRGVDVVSSQRPEGYMFCWSSIACICLQPSTVGRRDKAYLYGVPTMV